MLLADTLVLQDLPGMGRACQRPVLVLEADCTGKGQREGIYATNWRRGGARGGTWLLSRVNYTGLLARMLSSGLAIQVTGCVVCECVCVCLCVCVHT